MAAERRPVLYLDIDDTLLGWTEGYPEPAAGVRPFLLWALEHYRVRWLSTWCRSGRMEPSLLGDLCTMVGIDADRIGAIEGFDWREGDSKINGIAWLEHLVHGRPFAWVEDQYGVGERELAFLGEHGFRDCYHHCNVSEDPSALTRVHERLRDAAGSGARLAIPVVGSGNT